LDIDPVAASPGLMNSDCAPPPTEGSCDPLDADACGACWKCASVTVQASPTIVQTLCVPNGGAPENGSCHVGAPGAATGFDDCQAGNECIFGVCRPVCAQQGATVAGTCEGEAVCQRFNNLFEDVDGDVGICIPQCDPVSCNDQMTMDTADDTGICLGAGGDPVVDYGDQCPGSLQCYMNVFDGIGVCSSSFAGAPTHGMACGDACALNGCAPGSGPYMPGGDLAGWESEAVFFANTIFGLADVCIQYCDTSLWTAVPGADGATSADFQANCPPDNECRMVNGLYLNFDDPTFAPDNLGLCIPNITVTGADNGHGTGHGPLGSCADHVVDDLAGYLAADGISDPPVKANPDAYSFVPGCSSGQAILDKLAELNMMMTAAPSTTTGPKPVLELRFPEMRVPVNELALPAGW